MEIPEHIKKNCRFNQKTQFEAAPRDLLKYDPGPHPCQDCGKTITKRRIDARMILQPEPHWRAACSACKMMYNYQTGEFDIMPSEYSQAYRSWRDRDS